MFFCIFEAPKMLNMNELERMKQLSSARKLKEREETPVPFADPYSDMSPEEKSKMIIALMAARERDAERIRRDEVRIDELLSLQKAAMTAEKERDDYKQLVGNLMSKITALEEQLKVRTRTFMVVRAKRVSIKRSRRSKRTLPVTRMISTVLPNPFAPPYRSMVRLLCEKRTWLQNQKSPVFIVKDFLTVP